MIGGQKVILLKPQTYMNSSGESIRAAADYYKVDPEDILVVYDDISLAPGQLRIRAKGSAGGHNGIKSIMPIWVPGVPQSPGGRGRKAAQDGSGRLCAGPFFPGREKDHGGTRVKEDGRRGHGAVEEGIDHAMNSHNRKKDGQA